MSHILICDDEPLTRLVLRKMLEAHGYAVSVAATGEAAIEMARGGGIDLILLDLFMPSMSGWETVAVLRNRPETSAIPIVIISICAADDSEGACYWVDGWVEKPIPEARLLLTVQHALQRPCAGVRKILMVEDDLGTAATLRRLFEKQGMTVYHALSSREAIEIANWTRPDLLLLDVGLPELDGFGLVRWLRKHDRFRHLPLMVYSGLQMSAADRGQLRLGQTEFFDKTQLALEQVQQKMLDFLQHVSPPPAVSGEFASVN